MVNIVDRTNRSVTWYCYNRSDGSKSVALKSGNLGKKKRTRYLPPDNGTGWYAVKFTRKDNGRELAMGTVRRRGKIILTRTDGGGWATASRL